MARDPLLVLLSVRQRTVEQARQALGHCMKAEADIAAKIKAHDQSVRQDHTTGAVWDEALLFHEMSARRLVAMRAARQRMQAELVAAEARSASARGFVVAARTAAEAVEQLISERAATAMVEAAKREQHGLDDIARTRHAARSRGDRA